MITVLYTTVASDSRWGSSLRQATASLRICSSLKDTTIVFKIIPASCNLMSPRFPLITMRPFFTPTNTYLTNTLLSRSVTQSCLILCDPMVTKTISPQSMGFHRQEYEVDCHFLLQGIFPTQGSITCLLHWQVDSLPLSHWECKQMPLFLASSSYVSW